jgi:hypothetical protein
MWEDPIVAEIRRVREEHAAKFNYDLHAICEDLREQERQSGRKFVSYPPRRIALAAGTSVSEEAEQSGTEQDCAVMPQPASPAADG